MKGDIRSVGSHLAGLARVALRSFAATVFVVTSVGVVLAGLSYYVLRDEHWVYGAIAVTIALVESVATGLVLGVKRAVVTAVAHGLGELRLGRSLVRRVFERVLGVAAGTEFGERGGTLARGLERLPLARAEELLSGAVRDVTGEAGQGGWLRRMVQAQLFRAVQKYTLSRFREEGAAHGGVDLLKVKDELEQTVDEALVRTVRGGLRLWTALVIVALPTAVAVQTWVIILLLHAKG
ncbi:hypothetical protein J0H58_27340 [bacterium]|nr:hypothetical protein [bacterium]